MYLRLLLVGAVVYFAPKFAFAEEQAGRSTDSVAESQNQPEEVVHRQSLAVYMGLTPSEVVFGKPRNFRSEGLNNFALDPLTEADEQ
jgi:hypothetical protein